MDGAIGLSIHRPPVCAGRVCVYTSGQTLTVVELGGKELRFSLPGTSARWVVWVSRSARLLLP